MEKRIFRKTIDGKLIEETEEVQVQEELSGTGAEYGMDMSDDAKSDDENLEEAAKQPVNKDMNIKDILRLHPESSVILMSIGMGCISCFAAEMESLAEACVVHGLDPDDVTEYLNGELGLLPVE